MKYRKLGHGVAKRHGVSNAQVALAWLLAQGDDAGAPDVVLTGADLAAIAAAGSTARTRYNEQHGPHALQ